MKSIEPWEGSVLGKTTVNVEMQTGSVFSEGDSKTYQCGFEIGTDFRTTTATRVSDTLLQCYTPDEERNDEHAILQIFYGNKEFSKNSISFVYTECAPHNKSCSDCNEPERADCGWCVDSDSCTNSAHCDGSFLRECPVILGSSGQEIDQVSISKNQDVSLRLSGINFNTSSSHYSYSRVSPQPSLKAATTDGWICEWSGSQTTTATVDTTTGYLSCAPPQEWVGTVSLLILHGDPAKFVTEEPITVYIERPRETSTASWGSGSSVTSIVFTSLTLLSVVFFGLTIFLGTMTPVVRSYGRVPAAMMFSGAIILLIAHYLYLGKINRGMCIARPWFTVLGINLMAAPYNVKMIFKILFLNNAKTRFKGAPPFVYPLAFGVVTSVTYFVMLLWMSFEAPEPTLTKLGDFENVYRCKSDHSNLVIVILHAIIGVPFVFDALGFLLTTSVKMPFNSSRWDLISLVNGLLFSALLLSLWWFAGLSDDVRMIVRTMWIINTTVGTLSILFFPMSYLIFIRRSRNVPPLAPEVRKRATVGGYKKVYTDGSSHLGTGGTGSFGLSSRSSGQADAMMATVVD